MSDLVWFIRDYAFPVPRPFSEEEKQQEQRKENDEKNLFNNQVAALPAGTNAAKYLVQCSKLVDAEDARRQSVDARLTSILGLSSIAGMIVFSGILAEASGTLRAQTISLQWVMAIGSLYLALQICAAILAAVRGLESRGYQEANASGTLPAQGQAHEDYVRAQLAACAERVLDHRKQNNSKLDHMIAAHRAMKNFVAGLILVAVLGVCFAIAARPTDDLVEALKKNHDLSEQLRGPKGDPGPPGAAGAPCEPQLPTSNAQSTKHKQPSKTPPPTARPHGGGISTPPCR